MTDRSGRTLEEYRDLYWAEKKRRKELEAKWDYIKTDPKAGRHLLGLLADGRGDGNDFDKMIDRMIASRNAALAGGEDGSK